MKPPAERTLTSEPNTAIPPSTAPTSNGDAGDPPEPWGWTRRQRIGLGILLGLLLIFLGIQWFRRPVRLSDPIVTHDGAALLPRQVDPNTASLQELSRIPHIGEALAQRIIDYREPRRATAAEGIVFRQASDLDRVPGVGPALIEQLAPFLRYPESPETAPQP